MRYLKYLVPILLLFFAVTSCKKHGEVKPITTKTFDTDAFIHQIQIVAPSQFVATSVKGDTLKMIYYENVSMLIPTQGYTLSYSLHLVEDFSTATLKNFDYTTIDQQGDVTYDWVDDNLNDITAKTVKDTVIKGIATTKITLQRPFIFSKTYNDAQSATDEENVLLNTIDDNITFTAYVYFTVEYPATTVAANVFYLKTN